jgi:hypothetical protein
MKLKEKLARDYYNERPEGFGEPTNDFIAGFEKARELAQNECMRFVEYESPEVLDIEVRIGEIGEEEVE